MNANKMLDDMFELFLEAGKYDIMDNLLESVKSTYKNYYIYHIKLEQRFKKKNIA